MKKHFLTAFAVALIAALMCISVFAADITVSTADELVAVMNDIDTWKSNITLAADIDLSGKEQTPIGTYDIPFEGTFDGAGFTVSGVNITTDYHAAGLFGVVEGAIVKNLTVDGKVECTFAAESAETKVDGLYSATGGVVGVALTGTTLENLTNNAEVAGPCNIGGVVGIVYNFGEDIVTATALVNNGTVTPTLGNCGGVFGRIYVKSDADVAATVDACVNYAAVISASEDRNRLGGIAGYVRSESGIIEIKNCRNEGEITGSNSSESGSNIPYVGGIVGRCENATGETAALALTDCVNTGKIDSTRCGAGIITYISSGATCTANPTYVSGCVNTGRVSGSYYNGGIIAYTECVIPAADENGNALVIPAIRNNLNAGVVEMGACSGGIIGRVKNVTVEGNVTVENMVYRVWQTDGGDHSVFANNYYMNGPAVIVLTANNDTAVEYADVAKEESYAALDFDSAWTMGASCPMPKNLSDEPVTVTAPVNVNNIINNAINDATDTTEEAAESTADVTEAVAETPEGGINLVAVVVVAVIVVAAVVVVVIVKKKK